ncbi:MAG: hypothetical protein Q8R36_01580 [bacterium]|nr:hypothetical protein [bacterium]
MLYLFYGSDFKKVRAQCDSFLKQLYAKKPDASFFEYDSENFTKQNIEELMYGQGLFEQKHIVLLRELLALPEVKEFILENMLAFAESPNVFIFIEQKLDAPTVKKLTEHVKKIWKFDNVKRGSTKTFNPFALGDAFAGRDRRVAWGLFCRAIDREHMAPEAVHGILFSQVKYMLLAKRESENPGLNPYVFQKAKQFSKNYSVEELEKLSSSLVLLYHDARRGICDMRIALERLILNI